MNDYREDWVQPVTENVFWICQLPRSGGTLLLRLLDSHPQIHTHPAVFGFENKGRIWPHADEILKSGSIRDVFSYMSLEKFHRVGIRKQSSNMPQKRYPIYFDGEWYRDIFDLTHGESPRDYFNGFFTALFNAWRNNQNLYGPKKIITGQMTLRHPELYRKNFDHFRQTYPEGQMVFMVRQPDDWLASAIKLEHSTPFNRNPHDIMDYYNTIVAQAVDMAEAGLLTVFRFEDLVLKPRQTMGWLARKLSLDWNELLLSPTFNGAPFFQNSSFDLSQKSSIDKNVIGRGKDLAPSILDALNKESLELYERMIEFSVPIS